MTCTGDRARWYDQFEVTSSVGEGWLLLDLPGSRCDVTQPDMRTMSQRLRKAQKCAAAGGKYGLLQAVLLALDSQPNTSAQWVREGLALEACSRVLLPEAHEKQVDMAAARVAYQRLSPAEQQLWRQLQVERIQLFNDSSSTKPDNLDGYLPDECYIANVLGGVTGDVTRLGLDTTRQLLHECRWGLVITLSKRYGLVATPGNPTSIQAAYNWALACYHHHGKRHPETQAALAACQQADPQAWAPKLLAGVAYPALSLAAKRVPGDKVEAVEYVYHYGSLWLTSGADSVVRQMELLNSSFIHLSEPLKWLLTSLNVPMPTPKEQRQVVALRLLACGDPAKAYQIVQADRAEAIALLAGATWPACREELEQRGVPHLLRALVIATASLAALTVNLPPVSAAPELWTSVGSALGVNLVVTAGTVLQTLTGVIPWINKLVHAYTPTGPPTPAFAIEQARKGFWNPYEIGHLMMLAPLLSIAAARWYWQLGDAAQAHHTCRLEPGCPMYILQKGVEADAAVGHALSSAGMIPLTDAPLKALVAFLSKQTALQRPGTGVPQLAPVFQAAHESGAEAAAAMIPQQGDPQEQQLYGLFPRWLDQLVSQVTGRPVSLVIQPEATHSLEGTPAPACSIQLKDAASGVQQAFYWKQPGDADGPAAHQWLVQQAISRGCTDADLQRYCPAVEPTNGAPAAGSSGGSSSVRQRQQQQRQHGIPDTPGGVTGGTAATTAAHSTSAAAGSGAAGQRPATAAAAGDAGPSTASSSSGAAAAADAGSSRVKPSRPCAQCGEVFPKLQKCSKCKSVAYCSRECQVTHWRAGHKQTCQPGPGPEAQG